MRIKRFPYRFWDKVLAVMEVDRKIWNRIWKVRRDVASKTPMPEMLEIHTKNALTKDFLS